MVCQKCGFEKGSDRPGSRGCQVCGATLPYEIKVTDDTEKGGWILVREHVGTNDKFAGRWRIGYWQRNPDGTAVASVHHPFNRNHHEYGRDASARQAITAALKAAGYK